MDKHVGGPDVHAHGFKASAHEPGLPLVVDSVCPVPQLDRRLLLWLACGHRPSPNRDSLCREAYRIHQWQHPSLGGLGSV